VIARDLEIEVNGLSGAGAAGGLGAGLVAFCGAQIRSGASLVLERFAFDELLESADLVITGEGKLDQQTSFGKAISTVELMAEKRGVPVIAFTGCLQDRSARLANKGISVVVPIVTGPMTEGEAMARAGELLQLAAERTMRLLIMGRGLNGG
jgi:glycerate kinase